LFNRKRLVSEPAETRDLKRTTKRTADHALQIVPSNYQHIGARGNQEDSFAFSDLNNRKQIEHSGILAVVADGMGGLQYGEEASRVAVAVFLAEYGREQGNKPICDRLLHALTVANAAVYDLAYSKSGKDLDLGTTLVATVVLKNKLFWVSVGDSRIYLYRNKQLEQLTTDHIYANHLQADVDQGRLSQEEADQNPERNYLTSYLGLPEIAEVGCSQDSIQLKSGDRLVLCSDGLYDSLSDQAIIAVLESSNSNDLAEELVGAALAVGNPHQDNVTVASLSVI
jgi:PPM family protein phosphatase